MTYIKAQVGPANYGDSKNKFTVHYFDSDGNMYIRSDGTRAWRCNNPGNLIASSYSMSKKRKAIGKAGDAGHTYAVYPDYQTGREALTVMMRGSIYSPLTLRNAMKKYDPSNPKYINQIIAITALDPERTIKSLNATEFEKFCKAVEKVEHWEVGREDFIDVWYITSVKKHSGTITEFFVRNSKTSKWISKKEAIELAKNHYLHATLARSGSNKLYIRPKYGKKSFSTV